MSSYQHSKLNFKERSQIVEQFEGGQYDVLVGTTLIATAIQLRGVHLVINHGVPQDEQDYIGRMSEDGPQIVVNLLSDSEELGALTSLATSTS